MSNIEIIDRATGKIYEEYLPASVGSLTLAEVLKNGNTTNGTKIIASFGSEGEGGIETDKIDTNVITSLNTGEVYVDSNLAIADGGKIHFNGELILESQINEFQITGIQQSEQALPNVLAYDIETNKITWQNAGAGSTAVNSITNYNADNSIQISQPTGAVEIKLSDKGTLGTYTTPSSMIVDNQGRISGIVSGPNVSNWSSLPALSSINANNNTIQNCPVISSSGYLSLGVTDPTKEIIIDAQMRINNKPLILAGLNAPLHAVGGTSTAGTVGQVLSSQGNNNTPAWINTVNNLTSGTNINVNNANPLNPIVNLNINEPIQLSNGKGTQDQILTSSGPNVAPIWTDKPAGAENWSYFQAISDVNMNDKNIDNCGDINFKSGGRIETDVIAGMLIEVADSQAIVLKANNENKVEITQNVIKAKTTLDVDNNSIVNATNITQGISQDLILGRTNNNISISDSTGVIEIKAPVIKMNSLITPVTTLPNVVSFDPQTRELYYQPASTGVVESVNAGTNIFVNNTDITNPIINLEVIQDINMQNNGLTNVTNINGGAILNINAEASINLSSVNDTINCNSDLRIVNKNLRLEGGNSSLYAQNSAGTSGQVLVSQGAGQTPAWQTMDTGVVDAVVGGSNISVNSGTPSQPIVSLTVSEDINMNSKKIINALEIQTSNIKPAFISALSPNNAIAFNNDINMLNTQKIINASVINGNSITIGDETYVKGGVLVDNTNGDEVYLYGKKLNINTNQGIKLSGNPGTTGQVLTSQGANMPIYWSNPATGIVESIVPGTNIQVDATDPANPQLNMFVNGGIEMNNQPLFNLGEITAPNPLNLVLTKELKINNASGTNGQVLTSQGTNAPPIWTSVNTGVVDTIVAGTGININSSNPENPIVTNTGVTELLTSGTGISVSGSTGSITLQNTGVTQLSTSGTGISVSGSTGSIVLQNTGVTKLTAGPNVSLSQQTGEITISATGGGGGGGGTVTSVSGGTNITVTNGTTTPTVTFNPSGGVDMLSNAITNASAINNIAFSAPNTNVDASTGSFIVSSSGSEIININNTYIQLKRAIQAIEELNILKDLKLNGSSGTSGQVLQSMGAGVAPMWVNMISNEPIPPGGNVPILGDSNGFATAIDFNYYYGGYIV